MGLSNLDVDFRTPEIHARIAAAAFNTKLRAGGGFEKQFRAGQGTWKPLQPRYERKKLQSPQYGDLIWVFTGKTYEMLVDNELSLTGENSSFRLVLDVDTGKMELIPTDINRDAFYSANARRPWFQWVPEDEEEAARAIEEEIAAILEELGFAVKTA